MTPAIPAVRYGGGINTLAISVVLFCFSVLPLSAITFEELDKAPEGAHKGQMLVGGFFSVGKPYGDIISAEESFLSGSTHTFENQTTKENFISHLAFSFGVLFEYMPIDYVGARTKFRRSVIVQRSNYGSDYENWKGYLYQDYALYVGPAFHATNRRSWDFVFIPMIGYSVGRFTGMPVAKQVLADYSAGTMGTGREVSGLTYGFELNFTGYLSGGPFISIGFEMIRNPINFGGQFDATNPQNRRTYADGKSSGTIDSYSLIISSGYAFSN